MSDHRGTYLTYRRAALAARANGARINPDAAAAQACLETGFGKHVPPGSNNVLGIKAGSSWLGPVVNAATHEYLPGGGKVDTRAWWRVYEQVEHCFEDYGRIIGSLWWFRDAAMAADAESDPETYLRALEPIYDEDGRVLEPGYFTDPRYVEKAMSIVRAFAPIQPKEPTFDQLYPPLEGVTELWLDNRLVSGVIKARPVGRKLFVTTEPIGEE